MIAIIVASRKGSPRSLPTVPSTPSTNFSYFLWILLGPTQEVLDKSLANFPAKVDVLSEGYLSVGAERGSKDFGAFWRRDWQDFGDVFYAAQDAARSRLGIAFDDEGGEGGGDGGGGGEGEGEGEGGGRTAGASSEDSSGRSTFRGEEEEEHDDLDKGGVFLAEGEATEEEAAEEEREFDDADADEYDYGYDEF